MATSQTTTKVIKFAAAGDAITATVYLKYLRWVGQALVTTDTLVVKDTAGNIIAESSCGVAKQDITIWFPDDFSTIGINVDTMGHGVLYAYIR